MENFYISRNGIKDYKRNNKPLIGDNVQAYAPFAGMAMVDGTICDIYLVNDQGQVVGRSILVAACDANTSICMGYSLLWEGGVYSLQQLLLNILDDKNEFCSRLGIPLSKKWNISSLPGVFVTDMGSEYIGNTFEQITEFSPAIAVCCVAMRTTHLYVYAVCQVAVKYF